MCASNYLGILQVQSKTLVMMQFFNPQWYKAYSYTHFSSHFWVILNKLLDSQPLFQQYTLLHHVLHHVMVDLGVNLMRSRNTFVKGLWACLYGIYLD